MFLTAWYQGVRQPDQTSPSRGRVGRKPQRRRSLTLELLEDRTLPSFIAPLDYDVGSSSPVALAAADLTGDGKLDLITANVNSNNVSVLLGNGDGTFGPGVTFPAGLHPVYIETEDLNGDGSLDLVVVNAGDIPNGYGTVSVFLGNGDGSFRTPVNYPVGRFPTSVTVEDFNGDGIPDLAVTNSSSNTVSILYGVGDGTFSTAVNYVAGPGPASVATGHFKGDGLPDLAVADGGSNQVVVLLNVEPDGQAE